MLSISRLVVPALALIASGIVGTGLAEAARAAEPAYFTLAVGDLTLDDKPESDDDNYRYTWQRQSAWRPYVVLDGAGEAYWQQTEQNRWSGFRLNGDRVQRGSIAIRVPDGSKGVSGRLFYPSVNFRTYKIAKFQIAAEKASSDRRKDFFEAKTEHYDGLLQTNVPGAAWFRHESRVARLEWQGQAATVPAAQRQLRESFRPGRDFDDTYSLFSGNRAVSENLQLDRVLPAARGGDNNVDGKIVALEEIKGVTVKEIDWKPYLKDKQPKLDPLATSIPADQHVVFFASFEAMMQLADEADRQGTPLLQAAEPQSQQVNVVEKYQRQIGLSRTMVGRMLGPSVIKSVALTGGDAYFRIGTDLALVFEPQDLGALEVALMGQVTMNTSSEKGVVKDKGKYEGVKYSTWLTADRKVSSYLAVVGKAVVVTNSLAQLKKLIDVQQGKQPAIASLEEFKFFRDRYKLGEGGETAFLFLSDATIRRWCGPKWRLADARRVRDLGVLTELQAANMPKLATKKVEPGPIHTDLALSTVGELRLTSLGVSSATLGSLDFMTPIAELPLENITKAEATAYERWRDGYQRNFSWAFDPIGLRFTIDKQKLFADLTVMPLIDNTEYREFIEVSRGAKLKEMSGDPHDAVVQVAFAINKDSERVRQIAGYASFFAPQLKADVLSWFGNWITVYADDSPVWAELGKLKTEKEFEGFFRKNGPELPVAVGFEVSSAFKATALLLAVRGLVETSAPGMTAWETKQHGDDSYVKISPTPKAIKPTEPEARFAVYYCLTAESLTFSLSEKLIQDMLARKAKREAPKENAEPIAVEKPADDKPAAATKVVAKDNGWLGENLSMQASSRALDVFAAFSAREYQSQMQKLSWDNVPILNEWRRLYPDQDPVALHERIWGVKLTCPGGGKYVWNKAFETMESTVYGHPGEPKIGSGVPPQLTDFSNARFGLTFEEQGLRARAELTRKK